MPKPDFCKLLVIHPDRVEVEVDRALIAAYWQDRTRRPALLGEWFAPSEADKVVAIPVLKRQLDWLAGRIAAKLAVMHLRDEADAVNVPVNEIVVAYDTFSRPHYQELYLSISHTIDRVVAVCATLPVGVDVETKSRLSANSLDMALPGTEIERIQRDKGCTALDARALLWSLKEAAFKAWGQGAFLPFARQLSVVQWRDDGVVWHWDGDVEVDTRSSCKHWQVSSEISQQHVKVAIYEK